MIAHTNSAKVHEVMRSSRSTTPAHAPPVEDAHYFRNNISAASIVVTEAAPLHDNSAEHGDLYPAAGILSYAQNREDILLWRVLRDLPEGFYIDLDTRSRLQIQ